MDLDVETIRGVAAWLFACLLSSTGVACIWANTLAEGNSTDRMMQRFMTCRRLVFEPIE
jgi:hypothetical protein